MYSLDWECIFDGEIVYKIVDKNGVRLLKENFRTMEDAQKALDALVLQSSIGMPKGGMPDLFENKGQKDDQSRIAEAFRAV